MSETAIEAKGLSKHYGPAAAVDGIDLTVRAGEIYGLLGPNGSGKTTTILMLLGLTEPTGGQVRVLGFDPLREPLAVKRHVGYLPDAVGFYDHLTARENLLYVTRLAGIPRAEAGERIDRALERVRLRAVADRRVATFSRGMRQRLGLAEVLLKDPQVVVLDEPTSGLDPQSSLEFLEMIRGLKRDGRAVLLSSHLLDRVQTVCDRVALFHRGRIALDGTVGELARRVLGGGYAIMVEARGCDVPPILHGLPGIKSIEADDSEGRYRIGAEQDLRAEVARRIANAGGALTGIGLVEPSLDTIYTRYFEQVRNAA